MAQISQSKSATLYLLCFLGLADVVQLEMDNLSIHGQILDKRSLRDHDLIVWHGSVAEISSFKKLRTVEDIFLSIQGRPFNLTKIGEFKKSFRINSNLFRTVVFQAIKLKNHLYGKRSYRKSVSYISFVKQDIDHGSVRKVVSNFLNDCFATAFPTWRCQDPADIECWGFWTKDDLFVGIRITSSSVRSRSYRNGERKASLRPTVAASMAVLSNPDRTDQVIDPMCGSGTLLIERGFLAPYTSLKGYDIDPNAVELANANIANTKLKNINICISDAKALSLESESINCILCNLPFGKTYGNKETNIDLYTKCLQEWARLMKLGGRAVLLTSDTKSFQKAYLNVKTIWHISKIIRLKVMGTWASCFVLHRL